MSQLRRLHEQLGRGETTARAVTEASLARIQALNPSLNAMSVVLADAALADADARDAAQAAGEGLGPLHGIPMVIKEELDVAGAVTTFGGSANTEPARDDSEVVRRLRTAGAVIVGKTAMPEFGAFPYTERVVGGATCNPWDTDHSPGGSSGGTAVAVAAGMVPAGIGGDGGGSIRVPAAFCGLFGLKPQRGRVTSSPMEHLWFALGTAGPLTTTVRDSALIYDVIRGHTETDRFRAGNTGSFLQACDRDPGRLRIGWSLKSTSPGIKADPVQAKAIADTAQLLAELGHDVREVHPHWPEPTAAFLTQYLAGIAVEAAATQHPDRLEPRTRQLLRYGTWAGPRAVERALRRTTTITAKVNRIFDSCDVFMTPVTAHRPPRLPVLGSAGAVRALVRSMPAVTYTAIWNLAGNPAASVPRGVAADRLPLAVQLVGRTDDEVTLLSVAAQLEAAAPWRTPPHPYGRAPRA